MNSSEMILFPKIIILFPNAELPIALAIIPVQNEKAINKNIIIILPASSILCLPCALKFPILLIP